MSPPRNPNGFAHNPLDRSAHHRTDPDWIAQRLGDPSSLVVPFWRAMPLIVKLPDGRDTGWLRPSLLPSALAGEATLVFLGVEKDIAYFALDVSDMADPEREGPLAGLGRFEELRAIAPELHRAEASILAQAKSLIDWHARHRFCAQCGARTVLADAGYKRTCSACEAQHFPRTDPVVITLATREGRCLLGRGPKWPDGFFSALAGFVEPGETIEQAAAREIFEETQVRVENVRIFASQPWPYPSSLMIGCFAEAASEAITVDGIEIAEARWFDRASVAAALEGRSDVLRTPPPLAIAHQLLRVWIAEAG
ncbi:MAG: NAD(+) diphosphatase [Alphaproteobacteria bacterium]|nr:NAD(+) diphosphatase [Alphaproteobacteria bacterium]